MKIGVVGIGKLGICTAEVLQKAGHEVVGYDTDSERVKLIGSGKLKSSEPHLEDYMLKHPITASDKPMCLHECDATFIIVPTPSDAEGKFSNKYVDKAIDTISSTISPWKYHLFNIVSTIMPGSCRKFEKRIFKNKGNRCFGITYNPEFIAQGSIIRDFENPDFILVGCDTEKSGEMIKEIYGSFTQAPVRIMSLENSEIAKIALNSFVTMKINYANMLAELCEKIPGGNIDEITEAISLDRRIGKHCLRGGTSYGGPCFPRDNVAFHKFCSEMGVDSRIISDTHQMNIRQTERLAHKVNSIVGEYGLVSIIGMSYKPGTEITEESASVNLKKILGEKRVLEDDVSGSDLSVVMLPMRHLDISPMRSKNVLDCWRTLEKDIKMQGGNYYAIGKG